MKELLLVALVISLFFNVVQFIVLVDYDIEIDQYNEAIQIIGKDHCILESKIAKGLCLERLW